MHIFLNVALIRLGICLRQSIIDLIMRNFLKTIILIKTEETLTGNAATNYSRLDALSCEFSARNTMPVHNTAVTTRLWSRRVHAEKQMLEVAALVQAVSDIGAGVPGGPWDGRCCCCCCSDCCGSAPMCSVQVRHNNASALMELCTHGRVWPPFAAVILQKSPSQSRHVPTRAGRGVVVLPLCHPGNVPWLMTSACRIGWEERGWGVGGYWPAVISICGGKVISVCLKTWMLFTKRDAVISITSLLLCSQSTPSPLHPSPHRPPSGIGISRSADFLHACVSPWNPPWQQVWTPFFLSVTKVVFVGIRASTPPPPSFTLPASPVEMNEFCWIGIGFTGYRF